MSLLTGIQKVRVPAPAKINLFFPLAGREKMVFMNFVRFWQSQTSGHGGNREIR